MEQILIFIKHHLRFLWVLIETGNDLMFNILFEERLEKALPAVLSEYAVPPYSYRRIGFSDAEQLFNLIQSQNVTDLEYFHPHDFDITSIRRQFKKQSFLMMGSFNGQQMVGYFFLRFFANKKCFVGRIIDKGNRGKGIGAVMNSVMYNIAWNMNFRCLSTISSNNNAVMHAHSKNLNMVVLKKLHNDYLLVEFVRNVKG